MSRVFADFAISRDGYCAGPGAGPHNPLGDGGIRIHDWASELRAVGERAGLPGGATGRDDELAAAAYARAGAYVIGRALFDEGEAGWHGPTPFRAPVFVVTSRPRDPRIGSDGTSFAFVTGGVADAVARARAAAGGRDVRIAGGATVLRQALRAGLVDELDLHIAPVMLGGGTALFDGRCELPLELARIEERPEVTHLAFAAAA